MPGMEILFCLLGGERRVGGAGLLAVDGLELCKGAAHVGGDVHMGDEAFTLQRKLHRAEGGVDRQEQDTLGAVQLALDEGGDRHDQHDGQHDRQV